MFDLFRVIRPLVLMAIMFVSGSSAFANATFLSVNDVKAGSMLLATKIPGRHVAAPLLATNVDISVNGPIARVKVRQSFLNPSQYWLEGRYVFPLPPNSAVHHMVMRTSDIEIVAEIKEKEAARKIYRQAQQSGRKAVLIEQHRPNMFTTDVANLAPGGTIEVEISYLQHVRYDQGQFKLRFPMVVAPRFAPRPPVQMVRAPAGSPTEPGDSQQTVPVPPVLHPDEGKLNPVKLAVHLDAGVPLASLKSLHHQIKADDWQDGKSEISLVDSVVPADRDFELNWTPQSSALPTVALFHESLGNEKFFLAMILPPSPDRAPTPKPRDVIFVLDKSGSMAGASMRQAKKALIYALQRLKQEDRFNIIRFASDTDALFSRLGPVTERSRTQAVQYVQATKAGGGTKMRPALLAALADQPSDGRLRQIVFLTDAAISNEAALFDEIASRIGQNRLFTVGIGSAPNSFFMQRAAELGRGTFTYIGNTQQVGKTMRALFRKIERPMTTGLAMRWDGLSDKDHRIDAYPGKLPDLYEGEPVLLAARITGNEAKLDNATLSVSGVVGGVSWQEILNLSSARGIKGAGTLWARARVKNLMMSLHRGADRVSVRHAVIATALRHKIVSRFTSLVAVEKQVSRPVDEPFFKRDLPLNLPNGWDFEKVFGEPATTKRAAVVPTATPPARQLAGNLKRLAATKQKISPIRKTAPSKGSLLNHGQAVRLPQGSTSAALNLIVGIIALVIGLIIMRRKRQS